MNIINGQNGIISLSSINNVRKTNCAVELFKYLNGLAPKISENHFERLDHQKDTRGIKSRLTCGQKSPKKPLRLPRRTHSQQITS